MQKDASYHEAAIKYNEELAFFADGLVEKLGHEEVKRWCRAVAKQHKAHLNFHKKVLASLNKAQDTTVLSEDPGEGETVESQVVENEEVSA